MSTPGKTKIHCKYSVVGKPAVVRSTRTFTKSGSRSSAAAAGAESLKKLFHRRPSVEAQKLLVELFKPLKDYTNRTAARSYDLRPYPIVIDSWLLGSVLGKRDVFGDLDKPGLGCEIRFDGPGSHTILIKINEAEWYKVVIESDFVGTDKIRNATGIIGDHGLDPDFYQTVNPKNAAVIIGHSELGPADIKAVVPSYKSSAVKTESKPKPKVEYFGRASDSIVVIELHGAAPLVKKPAQVVEPAVDEPPTPAVDQPIAAPSEPTAADPSEPTEFLMGVSQK